MNIHFRRHLHTTVLSIALVVASTGLFLSLSNALEERKAQDAVASDLVALILSKHLAALDIASAIEAKYPYLLAEVTPLNAEPHQWRIRNTVSQRFVAPFQNNDSTVAASEIRTALAATSTLSEILYHVRGVLWKALTGRAQASAVVSVYVPPSLNRQAAIAIAGRLVCEQSNKLDFSLIEFQSLAHSATDQTYTIIASIKRNDSQKSALEIMIDQDTGQLLSAREFSLIS